MSLAFAVLIFMTQSALVSPFDMVPDQIDGTEYESSFAAEEINEAENTQENQDTEDLVTSTQDEQAKLFNDMASAKLTILNIKNGRKKEVEVKVGETVKFEEIHFKMESCQVEAASFYDKLHIGTVAINGRKTVLSNNMSFAVPLENKYLLSISC